jgi:hypothetical protein
MSLLCAEPAPLLLLFLQEIISDRPIFPRRNLRFPAAERTTEQRVTKLMRGHNRPYV